MSKTTTAGEMIAEELRKKILDYFPKLTVYLRKTPTDFVRPSVLIKTAKIKNTKESAYILNRQITVRVLVFEQTDESGIPTEANIKETLMELLLMEDFGQVFEGFSFEIEDKSADENGVGDVFEINFSKVEILPKKQYPKMDKVNVSLENNKNN